MPPGESNRESGQALVKRCLAGEPGAMRELRDTHHALLVGVLQKRGAHATQAGDIVADLWVECVATEQRPSLLEKFNGQSVLRTWLIAVATNRLVDLKRRERFRGELPAGVEDPRAGSALAPRPEEGLTRLLRDSLQRALARCPPDALLILRLVYLHGLTQREAGRMWGWHESKVSRTIAESMRFIAHHTMETVRRRDAWLELDWQDFLDLCEGSTPVF